MHGDKLLVSPPAPPDNTDAVTLHGIFYQGCRFHLSIASNTVTFSLANSGKGKTGLVVVDRNGSHHPLIGTIKLSRTDDFPANVIKNE